MEEEESEDELVDTQAHGGGRVWNTTTYKRDRAPDQYELARDTMYQPMMNRLEHVNTSLHADIDALNYLLLIFCD